MVEGQTYYGLDKLSLNGLFCDNTWMKDLISYRMLRDAGVEAPLVSYVWLTVNGMDQGLYEEEQAALRVRLDEVRTAIAAERETTDGAEHFIRLVKQFTEIIELTDEIVATFIKKVEVHEPVKVDGQKQQEITVFYNFVGDVGGCA